MIRLSSRAFDNPPSHVTYVDNICCTLSCKCRTNKTVVTPSNWFSNFFFVLFNFAQPWIIYVSFALQHSSSACPTTLRLSSCAKWFESSRLFIRGSWWSLLNRVDSDTFLPSTTSSINAMLEFSTFLLKRLPVTRHVFSNEPLRVESILQHLQLPAIKPRE